jgi:hypothetical protein
MMGIPPLTFIFLIIMIPITLIRHSIDKARRKRKLSGTDAGNTWIGSWF